MTKKRLTKYKRRSLKNRRTTRNKTYTRKRLTRKRSTRKKSNQKGGFGEWVALAALIGIGTDKLKGFYNRYDTLVRKSLSSNKQIIDIRKLVDKDVTTDFSFRKSRLQKYMNKITTSFLGYMVLHTGHYKGIKKLDDLKNQDTLTRNQIEILACLTYLTPIVLELNGRMGDLMQGLYNEKGEINAQQITIHIDKKGSIEIVEAYKDVEILLNLTQQKITSNEAKFDNKNLKLNLLGGVTLKQGRNFLKGDSAFLDLDKGTSKILSTTPNSVNGVFY